MTRVRPVSLLIALCAGWLSVAVLAQSVRPDTSARPAPAAATPNTLTQAEQGAGWRLLFDGTTTTGWRGFRKTEMPAGWTVDAGVLTRTAQAGDIVTVEQFENFELAFDWMVTPAGNSGVFGRVTEDSTSVWHSALEYQILDNNGHADGKKPETSAGSAYALYAPVKDVTRALGQWNQGKIVMKGTHVEHWLNGVKIVELELDSPDFATRVDQSKFKPYAQFGKAQRGHIAIQDHGDKVSYRNIKIRPL
ncbi:MAG: DUF1080 domain-containing protein [Acidobacteriota bacterium]